MFRFRAPLPSGFPELLTPPSVTFSSVPSVVGVWIFSRINPLEHISCLVGFNVTVLEAHFKIPLTLSWLLSL